MATTFTATRGASTFPIAQSHIGGTVCQAWGTIALGTNIVDGDIWQMCWVPKGATITGGFIHIEDIDTGTEAADLMIGWAANGTDDADPNGLLLAHVFTGDISVHLDIASSKVFFGGVLTGAGPKTLAAKTLIQVEANTAADTFAAGQMTVCVDYISP